MTDQKHVWKCPKCNADNDPDFNHCRMCSSDMIPSTEPVQKDGTYEVIWLRTLSLYQKIMLCIAISTSAYISYSMHNMLVRLDDVASQLYRYRSDDVPHNIREIVSELKTLKTDMRDQLGIVDLPLKIPGFKNKNIRDILIDIEKNTALSATVAPFRIR